MKRTLVISVSIVCLLIFNLTFAVFSQEVYKFELMWGSYGAGDGQFTAPAGVAVDPREMFISLIRVTIASRNLIRKETSWENGDLKDQAMASCLLVPQSYAKEMNLD